MAHFRYIDHIRRPDGALRSWEEHNALAKYEGDIAIYSSNGDISRIRQIREAILIKEQEYERRSSLQKTLQSKR